MFDMEVGVNAVATVANYGPKIWEKIFITSLIMNRYPFLSHILLEKKAPLYTMKISDLKRNLLTQKVS